MLNEFLSYIESQVNKGLYVLGGQTEIVLSNIVFKDKTKKKALGSLKDWMLDKGQSKSNYNTVYKLYQKRLKEWGDIPFGIFDCSGLGMNWLYNIEHLAESDLTAHGMKSKCEMITKDQLKRGDWVFRVYTSGTKKGRAYHIGYVADMDLNIIEDKGKAYGVVKKPFDSSYWNACGRPSYFKAEIEKEEEKIKPVFTRVLKRTEPTMSGDDVKELQKLLNEVNASELAVDGRFGALTEKAVKDFQKVRGLTQDGKAGKNTITALGGIWRG